MGHWTGRFFGLYPDGQRGSDRLLQERAALYQGDRTRIALRRIIRRNPQMNAQRRYFLRIAAAAAGLPLARGASAQTYPSRPVRLPGGVFAGETADHPRAPRRARRL